MQAKGRGVAPQPGDSGVVRGDDFLQSFIRIDPAVAQRRTSMKIS
jgi:hypothetical protein